MNALLGLHGFCSQLHYIMNYKHVIILIQHFVSPSVNHCLSSLFACLFCFSSIFLLMSWDTSQYAHTPLPQTECIYY